MTPDSDAFAALRSSERARLERFAEVFDHVDASRYITLTEKLVSPNTETAQEHAAELIGRNGRRRDAVRAAIREFTEAATVAYGRRLSVQAMLVGESLPDRAEDRMRFLGSVERVVVALILWEELSDDDRDGLVGPWAALIDPIVGA